MGLLAFLFFSVSVLEILVLVAVEARVGLAATVGLILVTGVLGAVLVRRQGLWVLGAVRRDLEQGVFPGRRLGDAGMILVGGALLVAPGLLTDALGLVLMVPPARDRLWRMGARYFRHRLVVR